MWNVHAENPNDVEAIDGILKDAFETPDEAELVAALRADDAWLAPLSLVATKDDIPVAHVLFTRCHIDGVPALALAPCAVKSEFQKQGAGGAAIREGLEIAREMGEKFVVVLGHPGYYPRFGFERAGAHGIRLSIDVPDDALMVLALQGDDVPAGQVRYAAPFGI